MWLQRISEDWVKAFCQGSGAVNAWLCRPASPLDADVVNVSRAIGCGWQELACIRCVLQTSPGQQPIPLPSYRNCHSHQIATMISHPGDLLTRDWHSGKWRAYFLMRHDPQTHTLLRIYGSVADFWWNGCTLKREIPLITQQTVTRSKIL